MIRSRQLWGAPGPRCRREPISACIKEVADGMNMMLNKSHPPHIKSRGGVKASEDLKTPEDLAIAWHPEINQSILIYEVNK